MKTLDETYAEILEKLTMELPFSFSRFGDGEWNCIFGDSGYNCDKHDYFQDLGERLKKIVLSKPKYMMGIQELALRGKHGSEIVDMITPLDIPWYNADVLCKMSIYGRLAPFLQAIKKRQVLVVGPKYLQCLPIKIDSFVYVDDKNCWLEYEAVRDIIAHSLKAEMVVLFCASMMSNVLIDDFSTYPSVTLIDAGSLLDPYAGKFTRAYHKDLIL